MPYGGIFFGSMAEFPDGRGVLLFGGESEENDYEDRILELHPGASSWGTLQFRLEHGRRMHTVIPLQ